MGKVRRSRARRNYADRPTPRRRSAVLRQVYILPSLITTGALFCGAMALIYVFKHDLSRAAWLILLAALLDTFDGMIARLTNTESDFGLNYDSLSDLVTFGVAPAAMALAFITTGDSARIRPAVSAPCVLYIVFGALRLARFNVQASGHERKAFAGLPIPAAAGAIVSLFLVFEEFGGPGTPLLMPTVLFVLGFLMVSNMRYPSLKTLRLREHRPFDFLVAAVLLAAVLTWINSVSLTLLIGFGGYALFGPAREVWVRLTRLRTPANDAPPEAPVSGRADPSEKPNQ